MSLNPLRHALAQAGLEASRRDTPFKAEADAALAGFHAVRDDLERQVRRGEMTPKVARKLASEAAVRVRESLAERAAGYSPVPRTFLDRLIEATEARKIARDRGTLESLQRETNRLMRLSLVEQQLGSRAGEFEGQAYVRPMVGGAPAPTIDSLLGFHEMAVQGGDEAAMEWARRQLEAMRTRITGVDDQRKIDLATDRADRLNPRIVAYYIEVMRTEGFETKEAFVAEAAASRDANACAAAFLLARDAPEGVDARWVRAVLDSVREFPDVAMNALRAWEAEGRRADSEAAKSRVEYVAAIAEADSRFPGLEAPSPAEVERLDRAHALPIARAGDPIGLALDRRGRMPEEPAEVDAMARG